MIYLDNAATTIRKPKLVEEEMMKALHSIGNAGRGGHDLTLNASRILYDTRVKLAQLFGISNPSQIAFTSNATEALNIAIFGCFKPGDHVITTVCEHNSVLRPLYILEEKGVSVTYIGVDADGVIRYDQIEDAIQENTRGIVITHASNVTGNITDLSFVRDLKQKYSFTFLVDASQTAGIIPIDVEEMDIDILCFTGHKGLMGPQGTGGIYVKEGIDIHPLKVGGSGFHSYDRKHPTRMPEALEAGTLNGHGIAGLHGALTYLEEVGLRYIWEKETELVNRFVKGIKQISNIKLYGDFSGGKRVPIVALNLGDEDSARVSDWLWEDYQIAVRAGAHCAPKMHEALGTVTQGAVRFSFSYLNTEEEIDLAIKALIELSQ